MRKGEVIHIKPEDQEEPGGAEIIHPGPADRPTFKVNRVKIQDEFGEQVRFESHHGSQRVVTLLHSEEAIALGLMIANAGANVLIDNIQAAGELLQDEESNPDVS